MIITKKCRASETEKSRTEMPSSSYGSNQSASVDSLHSAASAHAPSGFMGLSKLLIARLAFIACLLAAAAALGWLAHHLLSTSEDKLGEKQFDYIAERALATAREKTGRQQQGARTFASIYANLFPDVAEWPQVALPGFDEIYEDLRDTSAGPEGANGGIGVYVQPEDVAAYEDFCYEYIEKRYPPGTGIHSFGKGVFSYDFTLTNTTDFRYHDNTGESKWGSPYKFVIPVLQYNFLGQGGVPAAIMINAKNLPGISHGTDALVTASKLREEAPDINNLPPTEGVFTPIAYPAVDFPAELGPSSSYLFPVYPRNDPRKIVGHTGMVVRWIDVLTNVFSSDVNGVYCVIQEGKEQFTFLITKGVPTFGGVGDLHDKSWTDRGKTITLTDSRGVLAKSAVHKLYLYPSVAFYATYETNNPIIATVGAVCIIVFTSLMFLFYDYYVRSEFQENKIIMAAKRKFMRFVSHEVRTPLNTVCMGIKLMQEDIHRMMDSIQKIARRGSSSSRVSETPPMLAQERPLMAGPLATQDDCTSIAVSQAADLHNLAEQIYTSADNAVDILNDLLNYDKIEHGELSLELTVIPIWCLLERTRQEFTLAAEAKLIHLDLELLYRSTNTADVEEGEGGGDGSIEEMVVHVADELPNNLKELRVIGDTIRIAQVIRNLVSNAIKFTPERGHVQIKTRILEASSSDKDKTETFELVNSFENHTFEPRGAIQFDVIDSGAGMTEEQLNDLFGQGVQFNVTQLQAGQGSGLGLYIAKGLVEQHGGRLMATSPGLGLGTCFRVILPLHHVPDDKLPSNLRHLRIHRSTGLERHSSSVTCEKSQHAVCSHHVSDSSGALNAEIHILVVDDAAMNRKMLMRLLKNRGYICDQAENGQQALKRVEEAHRDNRRYDSILMDYEMPVMDGPTATRKLREMGCDSFIVGVTGNVLPSDVQHFLRNGANGVIPKPLKVPDLEGLWMDCGVRHFGE